MIAKNPAVLNSSAAANGATMLAKQRQEREQIQKSAGHPRDHHSYQADPVIRL
jgi:hypothetical protein